MLRLSGRPEYSLIATDHLSGKCHAGQDVRALEIAREENIRLRFLQRLLA